MMKITNIFNKNLNTSTRFNSYQNQFLRTLRNIIPALERGVFDMKIMNEVDIAWNVLLEIGVSEETLQIVTSINGYNIETLQDILYVKSGLREFNELYFD